MNSKFATEAIVFAAFTFGLLTGLLVAYFA